MRGEQEGNFDKLKNRYSKTMGAKILRNIQGDTLHLGGRYMRCRVKLGKGNEGKLEEACSGPRSKKDFEGLPPLGFPLI